MTLVRPSSGQFDPALVGTRGFGAGTGISKIGAGIQAGRLAYRLSKYAYRRYFGYATRTRSRAAGTATGAGLGLGTGLGRYARFSSSRQRRTNQFGQKRLRQFQRAGSKYQHNHCTTCRCC